MTLSERILEVADLWIEFTPGSRPMVVWNRTETVENVPNILEVSQICEHNWVSRQLSGLIPQEPARRSGHSGPVSFRLAPETHRKER